MDILSDLHTHSLFSDGRASIDTMAGTAAEKGLKVIAVTDHMPLPFETRYAMDMDKIELYRNQIHQARQKYKDRIKVLAGLEMEFSPELSGWIEPMVNLGWDHLIASVHGLFVDGKPHLINGNRQEFDKALFTVFNGDIQSLCRHYFTTLQQAFETGWFDAAGHLDVVKKHNEGFFRESDPWYRKLVLETLETLKKMNMKMEINTSGLIQFPKEQYPSLWIIRRAVQMGIPLVFGSDSHRPDTLGQSFHALAAGISLEMKNPAAVSSV
ncbi:histidinol-phosphatase [Desulfospira joergensenii]|uniref:histidinol-phosphatase n=1 Tax=Desulfospira joergensenii TaxID=53329 RepID=UPI0003B6090A|nr:histidinol-phosphatase [Desulfospira joergensenii]